MKTPISMIIVGKDAQERACTRLQLMGCGRVHIVAESGEVARAMELVEKFNPQSALIIMNGKPDETMELVRQLGTTHPKTAIVCTGSNVASDQIVRAYRAGATEFLCQPLEMPELNEVIEKIQALSLSAEGKDGARGGVIACFSARGGSGSSTVTVNLAAAMARQTEKPTVVVDLNLQSGTLPIFFGLEPTYSIADVAHNQDRLDAQLITQLLTKGGENLFCLAPPLRVEEADDVHPAHIERMLPLLTGQFAYVVVDCPHTLDSNTVPVLDAASSVLVISLLDLPAVYSTKRMLGVFQKMGYDGEKTKLVVNRYQKSNTLPLQKVEQVLGCKVHATLSDDHSAAYGAMNLGQPVVFSAGKSPLASQFSELAKLVAGADAGVKPKVKARSFSLFGTRKN
ncbi:MAG: AAA family ATPase [Acidobacteria bacterium]|nr:AAA family ATPase [Acidobacteriota bacterium]